MISCVFFDRDGIVNKPPTTRYVERLSEFHILDSFLATLAKVQKLGYAAIVITNQKGLSTGATPLEELNAMHQQLHQRATEKNLKITDIYFCDSPDDNNPRRKPNPGMIFEAAKRYNIDLASSWMIGDNEKDIVAGQLGGCNCILVAPEAKNTRPDFVVPDMSTLAAKVEQIIPSAKWRV